MAAGGDFDTTLHQIAQAILTVLAVINPVEINMVQLDIKYTMSEKRKIIVVATIFNGEVTYFKFKGLFHT